MTVRTELPPIDDKVHRIYYQHHHHHHYHVHHLMRQQLHNHSPPVQPNFAHRTCLHNSDRLNNNGQSTTNFESLKPDNLSTQPKVTAQLRGAIGKAIRPSSSQGQAQASLRSTQKSQIQFIIFAALTYVLSPIDLIPEVIFGVIGILDDLLFLLMCLFCVAIILIYPIFREMKRTIIQKLGLKQIMLSIEQ